MNRAEDLNLYFLFFRSVKRQSDKDNGEHGELMASCVLLSCGVSLALK